MEDRKGKMWKPFQSLSLWQDYRPVKGPADKTAAFYIVFTGVGR